VVLALRSIAPAILLFAAVSCGGDQGVRPQGDFGQPDADPCTAADGFEFQSIEDFEKGRAVTWWSNDDQGPQAKMSPAPGTKSPAAEQVVGGRCGTSRWAMHVTATDLEIWGGSLGYYFFSGPTDTTAWDGISFWVRRGSNPSGRSMLVSVDDRYTDESHGQQQSGLDQPYCLEETLDLPKKCDRFTAAVGIEEQWQFRAIPFAKMQQRGFGKPSPGLDRKALLGLEFSLSTGDWDVWIDDVAFYRAPGH
jgi:hypothetical protein